MIKRQKLIHFFLIHNYDVEEKYDRILVVTNKETGEYLLLTLKCYYTYMELYIQFYLDKQIFKNLSWKVYYYQLKIHQELNKKTK